jgi:3-oxoacyl-[acyl-carrier protein] reductase
MTDAALLAGKVALVTGGSRGIGRASVLALAHEGADVAFSYRTDARAAREVVAAVEHLGRRALAVASDAGQAKETEELVRKTRSSLGPVDVVVGSAGIVGPLGWEEVSPEGWRETLETDVVGPYSLVRSVRPHLAATGASIVLISSVAGLIPAPSMLAYSVAKAGVLSLARNLAVALAPNIRVNAVAPGFVRTDMNASLHKESKTREAIQRSIPRNRWGEADDVAAAVVFLASDMARFITGETLIIDGGASIRWTAGSE